MKKTLLLAGALIFGFKGFAQTYAPVALTGFTADVVANGSGSATLSTTNDVDGVSYALVAQNFTNPSGQTPSATGSLPNSGLITSAATTTPGLTFQLGAYTGNNSLRISGTGTSTLTFSTPQAADQVYVLANTGSGTSTVTMTVNFTDATTQVFPGVVVNDWYGGTNYAFSGTSRVNRTTDALDVQTTGPRLYQHLLSLSAANAGKTIQSIAFNKTTATGVLNVMGITIRTVASALATDAGITAITAPNSGCTLTSQETITVTVKNYGTTAQSNLPVSYKINNGTPVSEVIAGPIAANTSVNYSFTTKANLSTLGTYSIEARTNLTGDLAPTNDALTKSVVLSAAPAIPTISTTGAASFCTGGSVTLTAASTTSGVSYQWFNNGTAVANATNVTYNATAAGSYTVLANLNGCTSAASAATAVTVNTTPPAPGVNASGSTTICTGGSVALTAVSAVSGATFIWFKDGNVVTGATSASYTATTAGSYSATASANGCTSPASLGTTVTVKQLPATPTISRSGSLLTSSSTSGNQWYKDGNVITGATNATYKTTANGSYTVKVTTSGCTSATSNAVTITNTGIKDDKNNLAATVHPNPSAGIFQIALPQGNTFEMTVIDLAGKIIQQQKINSGTALLDLQKAAKGIYILQLVSEGKIATRKLVVE